jgi:hypothetical protein
MDSKSLTDDEVDFGLDFGWLDRNDISLTVTVTTEADAVGCRELALARVRFSLSARSNIVWNAEVRLVGLGALGVGRQLLVD